MPDALTITRWLVDHLAEELGIPADSIGLHEPLGSLGLGSAQAVVLSGDLAEWLGRALPPTLAYDFPTIAALAAHLADHDDEASGAQSPLRAVVALKPVVDDSGPERQGPEVRARAGCRAHLNLLRLQYAPRRPRTTGRVMARIRRSRPIDRFST